MTNPFDDTLAPVAGRYKPSQVKSYSHYNDPIQTTNGQLGGAYNGNSRRGGDASASVQETSISALM